MASVIGIPRSVARAFGRLPLAGRLFPMRRPGDEAIATLIEAEVIPRLLATVAPPLPDPLASDIGVSSDMLDRFTPLTLAADAEALFDQVDLLLREGVSAETILIDLLAPAARRLGLWWEEDRCDFVEVTMGLWRLQEVVRELAARVPGRIGHGGPRVRRALIAAMPGDQHGFGAVVVDEMFRRNGWDSEALTDATMPELLRRVGDASFAVVGLTVSCDCHIARLPSAILAIRSVSRNPGVRVLVGGRVFVEDPSLAKRVGSDGTAPDAARAVVLAEMLVEGVESEVAPAHSH